VCTKEEEIIGAAYLVPAGNPTPVFDEDWCYIRMVGVLPQYRGYGVARQLTKMCIEHAGQANERTIALHTSEFMDSARHLYESLGFRKMKEIDPIFGRRYWLYTLEI
jgi:ribosomal protein S18 acetylase RimI-like enzyme